ncbi:hypothetical protein HYH02_004019 [Chlamydomonas schloesseri]|uniref:Uncharacterized protein n=1 Tax=Chlamydomonas schloesseri TaxID=2026947 RepID=A0A835WPR3_9CHLO|nr:hypothetical protein HYH02_004019 [Chlamydomonas schloesseri]|eukprot:KAG2451420.1 hypothetical protein HYH02_004019 [Chlamydomonas schloesseri]
MPGCCVTALKNLYYNTARLVRDNPDDDAARMAAYEQVCSRLGTSAAAESAIAADGDADGAANVPAQRRPQSKRARRKPRRAAASSSSSSDSEESEEEPGEEESDDGGDTTTSSESESELEGASEPEEDSEETEEDEADEDFQVKRRRRPRKGTRAAAGPRARSGKAAARAAAAAAAAAPAAAPRSKLGRQGSDNASGSSTSTNAKAHGSAPFQLQSEAAGCAAAGPGGGLFTAPNDAASNPPQRPPQQQQPQQQQQRSSNEDDVTMALRESQAGPEAGAAHPGMPSGAAAGTGGAAAALQCGADDDGGGGGGGDTRTATASQGAGEPMEQDGTPRAVEEAANSGLLRSAVAVNPLCMQLHPPHAAQQQQPHSGTSSPLPPRFDAHSMPPPGAAAGVVGRLDSFGRRASGLTGGSVGGFFLGDDGSQGGGFDCGFDSAAPGAPHPTGSASHAQAAGPERWHHPAELRAPPGYMGRRAFSCDGRTALPMPSSCAPGSATAAAAAAAASAGMAQLPFSPSAASCDALCHKVHDHRHNGRASKPLHDFFFSSPGAQQTPAAGYHDHVSATDPGHGRPQQQQQQPPPPPQQQQQRLLPGSGTPPLQPLQLQPRQMQPQAVLVQARSVRQLQLQQPYPQPPSAGSSVCRASTGDVASGTHSTLASSGDGTSSRVLLCSLPELLPGSSGKRVSLAATAPSGSLAAAAAAATTSPCLLGSPLPGGGADGETEVLEGLLHSLERDLGIMSPAAHHYHHQPPAASQSPQPLQLLPHPRSAGSNSSSGANQHPFSLSGPHHHHQQQEQQQPRLAPLLGLATPSAPAAAGDSCAAPGTSAAAANNTQSPWLSSYPILEEGPDPVPCARGGGVGGKSPRRRLPGPQPSQPLQQQQQRQQQQQQQRQQQQQQDQDMDGPVGRMTDLAVATLLRRHDSSSAWGAQQQQQLLLSVHGAGGSGCRAANNACLRSTAFDQPFDGLGLGLGLGTPPGAPLPRDLPRSGDGCTPRSTADGYAAVTPTRAFDAAQALGGGDVVGGGAGGFRQHACCPMHGSPFASGPSGAASGQQQQAQGPHGVHGSGGGAGGSPWGGPSPPRHHCHHHPHHHCHHHPHHHCHHHHHYQHQPHCPLHRHPHHHHHHHCYHVHPHHGHGHGLSGAQSMPQPLPSFGPDSWPSPSLAAAGEGRGNGPLSGGARWMQPDPPLTGQQQQQQQQQQPHFSSGGGSRLAMGPCSRLASARVGPYPRGTLPAPSSPFAAAASHRGSAGGAMPAGGGPHGLGEPRQQLPPRMHSSQMDWASPTCCGPSGLLLPQGHPQQQQQHQQRQMQMQQHGAGYNMQRCYSLQNLDDAAAPSRLLQPLEPLSLLQPLTPLQPLQLLPEQQQQQQQQPQSLMTPPPAATDLHTTPNFLDGAMHRELSIPHTSFNNSMGIGCGGPGRGGISLDGGLRLPTAVEHGECVTSDTDLDSLVDNLNWIPAPEASWISR